MARSHATYGDVIVLDSGLFSGIIGDAMSAECSTCGADLVYGKYEWPIGHCEGCELRAERDEALALLRALADKCEEVGKASMGVFAIAKVHHAEYHGPHYGDELAAAKRFLEGREAGGES